MPVIGGDTIYVGPLWLVFRGCFCLFLHLIASEGKSVRLGLSIVIIIVSSRVDACVLILQEGRKTFDKLLRNENM